VLLPTMILIGIGFMLLFPVLNIQAVSGVANREQGLASGLVQTSGQVGAALILAVLTALIAGGAPDGGDQGFDGYHPGVNLVTGVALVGLLLNLVPLLNRNRAGLPERVGSQAAR
jgi:hypothetical protein